MTYDPKFSVKQMYDQYGRSRNTTKTAGPKGFTKKTKRTVSVAVDTRPSRSSGFGGMGPDPAERFGGSPTKGLGSKPDYSSSAYDSGADNNPNKDEYESKGVVAKLYDRAVTTLRNFGADEPEDVIVDGQRVYQGPLFRGYTPDTSNLFVDNNPNRDRRAVMPDSKINIFGVNTDNPRLNMFGVERKSFRNPDPFIPPVLPESPANMDPLTRSLSQAMIPPSDFLTTAEYTVSEGESLLTVLDTLNAGKPNSLKVTLEELGELNNIPDAVADPFGKIEKGQVIKVPVKKRTAVGDLRDKIEAERSLQRTLIEYQRLSEEDKQKIEDRYRLLEQAQPASADASTMDFVKAFRLMREGKFNEAAAAVGIGVETDEEKIQSAVGLASKQYVVKKGDTLSKIARANGTTLSEIKKANPNIDPDKLRIGQPIKLPQAGVATETVVPEVVTNTITPVKEGKLNIGTGNRNNYKDQLVYGATPLLSMDFNASAKGTAKGVEVIVPDWVYEAGPGNIYFDAAQNYVNSVIKFANDKGYGGYKARGNSYENNGVRSTTMNKNGLKNVIHIEPFFSEDTKMVNIINENKEEFFDLYYNAFKDLPTTIIPPHGNLNDQGVAKPGAVNDILGSELSFGREAAEYLINKYGNK